MCIYPNQNKHACKIIVLVFHVSILTLNVIPLNNFCLGQEIHGHGFLVHYLMILGIRLPIGGHSCRIDKRYQTKLYKLAFS